LKLYGQEYIADSWAMANMNLGEHGTEHGTGPNTGQSKKSRRTPNTANTEHGTVEKIGVKKGLERRALAGAVRR